MRDAQRIGFVGAGAMGSPMSEALLDAGHALAVFDPREEAMRPLVERGAVPCGSPAEVADLASTVLASLPTPDIVRSVVCGDGGLLGGRAMRTFVDLSTTGATVARELAGTLQASGIAYLDAPVSGGVAGVTARRLTAMASGERGVFEQARPLLETFCANVVWVGPVPGQGQTAKLLNNLLSAAAMAITSEAITFGARMGLDPATLLEIFNSSSGRNTATSDKFPKHVVTRGFGSGFRLALMAKDVELCLAEARSERFPMVVGGVVQQLWTLAAGQAAEEADHTEIVKLFEGWAGVTVGEAREGAGARG